MGAIKAAPHIARGTKVAAKGAQVVLSECGKGAVFCGSKLAEVADTGVQKIKVDMEQKARQRREAAAQQETLGERKA